MKVAASFSLPYVLQIPSTVDASASPGADASALAGLPSWPRGVQERVFRESADEVAHEIANGFADREPDLAARHGFRVWQKAGGCAAAAAALVAVVLWPAAVLVALVATTSLIALMGLFAAAAGAWRHAMPRRRGSAVRLTDERLPSYTVLVPAYQEQEVIGDLVRFGGARRRRACVERIEPALSASTRPAWARWTQTRCGEPAD